MKDLLFKKIIAWIVGGDLLDFVQQEVAIVNDAKLSGEEKRKQVFEDTKRFFTKTAGVLINLAIEAAVYMLKSKYGDNKR